MAEALSLTMNIIVAVLIIVVGLDLQDNKKLLFEDPSEAEVDPTLVGFLASTSWWFIIFVVISSISKLGVQTASFVAVIGAAGLAVGLALQGSLSNFAAGILLLS